MQENQIVGIGDDTEQKEFIARHALFLERFPSLRAAMNFAFARTFESALPVDRVVFALGRLCIEDFMEILVLAGNGYGLGALKILRGLYERVVTASYLHQNPDETDDFLDFYWVDQHRLTKEVSRTFGTDRIPRKKLDEIEHMFGEVKGRFTVTACRRCKTKRVNHSWSRLDFVSMARAVGRLGNFLLPAYYTPTQQIHASFRGIMSRLEEQPQGGIGIVSEAQRKEADMALRLGHLFALHALALQRDHFALGALEEPLDTCYSDFQAIWHDKPA